MDTAFRRTALLAALAAGIAALFAASTTQVDAAPRTLEPFRSEAQFERLMADWHARAGRVAARRQLEAPVLAMAPPPAPKAMADAAASASLDRVEVTGSRLGPGDEESITNVQTQGVDEGDIVKRRGDHLIVLRRGRLFSLRVGDDRLDPVAAVDAFGPDADPTGTWYDEMLVSDDTVAVIGYSYSRGGTEVGVFDLDARGGLKYRATYQLRSNDYYSSRNYASRLVGHTLVFYSPMSLDPWSDWQASMPAFRRWRDGATPPGFHRILPATRIYRGLDELDAEGGATLHTVSVCDLAAPTMDCTSTAVLGPEGRVFYVSEDSVFIWTTGATNARGTATSNVFRMPLDGGAPSALRTWGSPVDQMAFLQKDGWLNVLVARDGQGDGMWRGERVHGDTALLRVPLARFGDAKTASRRDDYRLLPGTSGFDPHQRFIGDWLVYGDASDDGAQAVHALRYASRAPVQTFPLPFELQRIDALGGHAVLVGPQGADLLFNGLRLGDGPAALAGTYRQRGAAQGDDRTHGFFYRPQSDTDGVLGLPILRNGGGNGSASVLYLRNRSLALSTLGTLDSGPGTSGDDGCRASCVDWYGNARPIFAGDRVFALMGYELVEGRIDGDAIHERRRVDFAPRTAITVR